MEEWKKYVLSDIADIVTGKTPSTKEVSYFGGSIHFITPGDINKGLKHVYSTERTLTESGLQAIRGSAVNANAICVSCIGNIGYVGMSTMRCATNQQINTLIVKDGFDEDFVYYLIKYLWPEFKNFEGQSTTLSILNKGQFSKIQVRVPSLALQKQIAAVLSSIDDKIELNNRINHNLEEQARHHFDEWCRSCNEEKSIAELSFNILDYSQNQRDKVILLNSSDVTEGIFKTLPYVENKDLKGQFKKRFRKGDILYSEIRPRNHHYAICYFNAKDYIASTRLMIIRRNPELLSSDALLYQYLLMPRVEEEFTSKTESRSGTFPQGNYEDLSSSVVPYSRENQIISKTLDALYSIIWLNMEENKRLASFRDALLPLLMSGDLTC